MGSVWPRGDLVVSGYAVCSHRLMQFSRSPRNSDVHPFGGCNRLLEQYQQVGRSLIAYERRVGGALIPAQSFMRDFRTSVSFVPVEVLESYLDDLLDLGVSDDSLFIRRPRTSRRALALLMLSAVTALYLVVTAEITPSAVSLPVVVTVAFLAGLGSALYFLPRSKVVRRFSFATVVSREIASRRGHDRTSVGDFATKLLSREFWVGRQGGRVGNMPPHPARVVLRQYH